VEYRVLTRYIQSAVRRARYKILPADGSFFGEIPDLPGVWASADALEACRDELEEVLEEWLTLSLARHLPIPPLDGVEILVPQAS